MTCNSFFRETPASPNNIIKLVVIGDSGAGKSQLVSRFVRDQFCEEPEATVGLDFAVKTVKVGDKVIRVQIWDLAGKNMFRNLTSSYYREAAAALVVYDITKVRSFENASRWIKDLRSYSGCDVTMLVGNKLDLRHQRSIPSAEGIKLAKEQGAMFIETSAKDSTHVRKAFHRLVEQASDTLAKKKQLEYGVENGGGLQHGSDALNVTRPKEVPQVTVVQQQPKKENYTFRRVAQTCLTNTKDACGRMPCCFY
uniref:Ras-related protein RABA2b-like n=1 Tax=Phallusia mammillata TaxID=59560 RepID=A0A6F9DR55_9ASCI|nr:ras-related protein RABA2b-like [Phallusia mammillata]